VLAEEELSGFSLEDEEELEESLISLHISGYS